MASPSTSTQGQPFSQNWRSLGTVQPVVNEWRRLPIESTSGNDLIRIRFVYPVGSIVKGWVWIRPIYKLISGEIPMPSVRAYPSADLKMLNIVIPSDLRERNVTSRRFEVKKGMYRPRNGIVATPYNWSVTLEEILD